jgi:RNA polymerase sigma factor (sigma-70 family)
MADSASGAPTRASLLRRIRDPGDTRSWQTFVDVYSPLIYRHARSRGLQDADAAEVTQEVLFQVSRSVQNFEYSPERGRFRDWLGTVAENKIRSLLMRRTGAVQGRGDPAACDPLATALSPEQETEWEEAFNRHLLQAALVRTRAHFEEQTWRAFELVWREERAVSQVAQEMGQQINWVYLAKSRVLKRLRAEIQELAEDMPLLLR